MLTTNKTTNLTRAVFTCPAVTEKGAILGIGEVVTSMTDFGTHSAHAHTVDHLARVTVVPVLVHKILLSDGKCAQLAIQSFIILKMTHKSI